MKISLAGFAEMYIPLSIKNEAFLIYIFLYFYTQLISFLKLPKLMKLFVPNFQRGNRPNWGLYKDCDFSYASWSLWGAKTYMRYSHVWEIWIDLVGCLELQIV